MNRITDITRQDLIDIIRDGIWESFDEPKYNGDTGEYEDGYLVRMPIYGRLSEFEFLGRLYNLDSMPSTDNRFSDASGDIWQHTVNNDDWEDFWYFSDRRFKLSNGNDDQYILKFICEMLHPAVRDEKSQWKKYLDKFNEVLEPDGYQLYPVKKISGRDVYEAHELDHITVSHPVETIYTGMKALGEGSYARVFKYTDDFYKKDFVLKRARPNLDEKELARFKREFDEMASLNSPYIVEVFSYDDMRHEYTMELMDCTLEHFIEKNNASMQLQTRRKIIMQLLRAFRYLHSKNIYHRDICPKNVLLKFYDDEIIVKISDFGLVKVAESDLTSENSELKGSLNDPALKVEGFGNYGLSHEIYAITLLFTYILTGRMNWAKIKEPVIKGFMEKGTNSDKAQRYQSLDELGVAVNQCIKMLEK